MKIYIMTDMEGATGLRLGGEYFPKANTPNYIIGQRLLTADVNAAIEGALEGGAKEIVVSDGHGGGSILVEELHPEAQLESPVSGRKGHYDVPVVLVTGDLAATIEAKKMLGKEIEVVAVKEGLSRNVAKSIHPSKAQQLIKKAAFAAISKIGKVKPLKLKLPIEIKLEFQKTHLADNYENKPNIKRIDGRTIVCKVNSQLEIFLNVV